MEYLRSVFGKKQLKLAIAGAISLLVALILTCIGKIVAGGMSAERMAERWSKTGDFAQVSCFFSEFSGFTEDSVKELNYKTEQKFTEDSLAPKNKDARLWLNAYSAGGEVYAESPIASGMFKAVGVGGDYFLFHPLEIINGYLFNGESGIDDTIVIDRDVAWNLFGSTNVVGQIVEIGGQRHVVCGVIERESGRINDLAGNDKPTIYMSYNSLSNYGIASYINMYEAMMPNPISGYAKSAVEKNLPVSADTCEIIENTGRFHWTRLLKNVKNFGTRGMSGKAIVYPYWENVARGVEDYLTPVAVMALLFYLFPIVLLILLLFRMWKKRTIHRNDVKRFIEDRFEEYKEKRRKVKKGEIYE